MLNIQMTKTTQFTRIKSLTNYQYSPHTLLHYLHLHLPYPTPIPISPILPSDPTSPSVPITISIPETSIAQTLPLFQRSHYPIISHSASFPSEPFFPSVLVSTTISAISVLPYAFHTLQSSSPHRQLCFLT
ncbi:hypothetical protein AYI70_g7575 [Smittium culicis]|uniref:Uncharacterized protein n=1 Tax=Smittium culicis TaxID=133412 RepID=A0A1R1XJZ1_9FUNG|nr:hypothetical protein AYI70_g7575 [Smittium culicis]